MARASDPDHPRERRADRRAPDRERRAVPTVRRTLNAGRSARRASWLAVALTLASSAAVVFSYSWFTYVALVAAVGLFAVLVARPRVLTMRVVVVCGVVALAVAALAPYRFSRDIAAYRTYGAIVAHHHASPYRAVPADFPSEPSLRAMNPTFLHTRSVYGPVFTGISALGVWITGSSPLAARLFFQLLAALAVLLAALLVARETTDARAVALVALNPVLVVSVVNGGHNDALIGLGVLGAVLALRRARWLLAGAVLALAVLVKAAALLPAAALLVWLARRDRRAALRCALALGVVTVAGLVAAGGLAPVRALSSVAALVSYPSPWALLLDRVPFIKTASLALVALAAAVAIARSLDTGDAEITTAATGAYLLGAAYVLPWYMAWVVPVAALRRSRVSAILVAASLWLLLAYFPLSTGVGSGVHAARTVAIWAARVLTPLALVATLAGERGSGEGATLEA